MNSFTCNSVGLAEIDQVGHGQVGVNFNLVRHWLNSAVVQKALELECVKVADGDRFRFSGVDHLLHRRPRRHIVQTWVDHVWLLAVDGARLGILIAKG